MNEKSINPEIQIRPATMQDLLSVVNLLNTCLLDQTGEAPVEEGYIRSEWETPGRDLADNTRVAVNADGQLVGYIETWDFEPHVRVYTYGSVHPDYRGQNIGTALALWAESRARQAIAKAPSGSLVAMGQSVFSKSKAAQVLLEGLDYRVTRHSYQMEIEMDSPPATFALPVGISIRPYRAGTEEEIVQTTVRKAFRDHWGYVERPFEEDRERWMHWIANDPRYDPSLWFVAVEGEQIIGISLCQLKTAGVPEIGLIDTLAVLRPWRRKGIGLALLLHSLDAFYQRGTYRVELGVDAQNLTGATRLYEKAGMRVKSRQIYYEKELRPGFDLSTQSIIIL